MKQREKLWTPRPWVLGESALSSGLMSVDTQYNYSQGFPMEVCVTWGTDDGQNNAVTIESRANAQLISAAPDLVEALEQMLSQFGGSAIQDMAVTSVLDQAEYALAKAYGDSQ